jgi:hypothetical protein
MIDENLIVKWPVELIEALAALEHDRWSGWERYREKVCTLKHHSSGESNIDRWRRQRDTAYADLSEAEKESDRAEVRKTLAVLEKYGIIDAVGPIEQVEAERDHHSEEDKVMSGTEQLRRVLYGRAAAGDCLGGSDAEVLVDAAERIEQAEIERNRTQATRAQVGTWAEIMLRDDWPAPNLDPHCLQCGSPRDWRIAVEDRRDLRAAVRYLSKYFERRK